MTLCEFSFEPNSGALKEEVQCSPARGVISGFSLSSSNPNASSSNQNDSLIDLETPAQPTGLPLQYANPYAQLQQQQAEMWAMQQQQEQLFLMRQQEEERMRQMQMQEQQNQDAQAAYFRQLYAQISAQREVRPERDFLQSSISDYQGRID